MKVAAVEKSKERLRRAADAIADIEKARTQDEFRDAWERFLVATKAIGEVLRTGARGDAASEAALAALWEKVRDDPLLGYLIEARNVEEHGLERSADYQDATLMIGRGGESFMLNGTIGAGGTLMITPMRGSKVTVHQTPQETRLLPVTDKRGRVWAVPTQHLGKAVDDPSPATIAKLGLAYFQTLVREAAAMVG